MDPSAKVDSCPTSQGGTRTYIPMKEEPPYKVPEQDTTVPSGIKTNPEVRRPHHTVDSNENIKSDSTRIEDQSSYLRNRRLESPSFLSQRIKYGLV